VQQLTNNVQEADIGSAIDKLSGSTSRSPTTRSRSTTRSSASSWSIKGNRVGVLVQPHLEDLSAWSKFTFPFSIDDACVLNQELYVRTGNDVYKVTDAVTKDGVSSIPLVDALMYFQDGKRPSTIKQFMGRHVIGTGNPTISWQVHHRDTGLVLETAPAEYPAITEPGNLYPIELVASRIAPHYHAPEGRGLRARRCMLHYDNLID
jgi:hypothetical protein